MEFSDSQWVNFKKYRRRFKGCLEGHWYKYKLKQQRGYSQAWRFEWTTLWLLDSISVWTEKEGYIAHKLGIRPGSRFGKFNVNWWQLINCFTAQEYFDSSGSREMLNFFEKTPDSFNIPTEFLTPWRPAQAIALQLTP